MTARIAIENEDRTAQTTRAPLHAVGGEAQVRPTVVPQNAPQVKPALRPAGPSAVAVPPPVRRKSKLGSALRRAASFAVCVAIPTAISGAYLWEFAQDRYVTSSSFSVRAQQQPAMGGAAAAMMGGMGGGASDAGVVSDFLASREVIERMMATGVNVPGILAIGHDRDPIFSLKPDASIEEVESFWKSAAHVERDPQSGIVRFSVKTADRDASLLLANAAMREADRLVNDLSESAVNDATRVAAAETERAGERAALARRNMQSFRATNAVVDPAVELEARMTVVTGLRQKLSDALIQRAGVVGNSGSGTSDVRVASMDVQISNLRAAIAAEEALVGADGGYALIASQYEGLVSEMQFSDEAWRAAIARADAAKQEADSKRAYLAVHSEPRMAGMSIVPNRWTLLLTVFGSLLTAWVLFSLISAAMKDRR